jgi:hypothetical protein
MHMIFQVASVQLLQQCFTSNQYFKSQAMTSGYLSPQTATVVATSLFLFGQSISVCVSLKPRGQSC